MDGCSPPILPEDNDEERGQQQQQTLSIPSVVNHQSVPRDPKDIQCQRSETLEDTYSPRTRLTDLPGELLSQILGYVFEPWWIDVSANLSKSKICIRPRATTSSIGGLPLLQTCKKFHRSARSGVQQSFNGLLDIRLEVRHVPGNLFKMLEQMYLGVTILSMINRVWIGAYSQRHGSSFDIWNNLASLPILRHIEVFDEEVRSDDTARDMLYIQNWQQDLGTDFQFYGYTSCVNSTEFETSRLPPRILSGEVEFVHHFVFAHSYGESDDYYSPISPSGFLRVAHDYVYGVKTNGSKTIYQARRSRLVKPYHGAWYPDLVEHAWRVKHCHLGLPEGISSPRRAQIP